MVEVKVTGGVIRGYEKDGYVGFRGIPYAKPPIGELRWKRPEPVEPWEGVKDCFEFGSPCCQAESQRIPGGDPEDRGVFDDGSEDCLFINVFTPDVKAKKLPVLFWSHGGAHCCGSGGGKNGIPDAFVSRGVVYVSYNYRLGLMGYFVHPELQAENAERSAGNYAHWDQLFALKWVKENIAAFGGDPDNITIAGCSAGAGATQVLMNSPLAEGLFARAIVESSLGLESSSYPEDDKLQSMEDMAARGVEFMERCGAKNLAELRAMPYEKMIDFPEAAFRRKFHYGTVMGTNEDGYLIPVIHSKNQESVRNANVPCIVCVTNDEGGEHILRMGRKLFEEQSAAVFGDAIGEYLELAAMKDDESAVKAARDTHLKFAGSKVFAELSAKAGKEPVWVCDFMHPHPEIGRAVHGTETQYLAGTHKRFSNLTPDDDKVADVMQTYWINFIKTGNPNGGGLPEWEPYSAENRKVLYLDADPKVLDDAEAENPLLKFTREFLEKKLIKD